MRIVKEAEERKNQILDAAEELFGQKGFDKTSTNDILEKVGIARGTLYYHFKSKEDIMDALIKRLSDHMLEEAKKISSDKSIPLYQRLAYAVMALNLNGKSGEQMIDHMHKPQNALMHQKVQKIIIEHVPAILNKIILEGIEEGKFTTPYPYEAMEMVIVYASTIFDGILMDEMDDDTKQARIEAFIYNIERLFGAADSSLANAMMQIFTVQKSNKKTEV